MSPPTALQSKWRKLVLTDPERVVRVISIPLHDENFSTADDDNWLDVFAAVMAIVEEIGHDDKNVESWNKLVHSGVASALARCCAGIRVAGSSDANSDGSKTTVVKPFYRPLVPLARGLLPFDAPPISPMGNAPVNITSKRYIDDVMDSWSVMTAAANPKEVNREIWHVAFIAYGLLKASMNAKFYAMLHERAGTTVQILARVWSTRHCEFSALVLTDILLPSRRNGYIVWDLSSHPERRSDKKSVFLRIYQGLNPRFGTSPTQPQMQVLAAGLVKCFARHLDKVVREKDYRIGDVEIDFARHLMNEYEAEPEFAKALKLKTAQPFWKAALELLRLAAGTSIEVEEAPFRQKIMEHIPLMMSRLLCDPKNPNDRKERLPLVEMLIDEGLFDILDECLFVLLLVDSKAALSNLTVVIRSILDVAPTVITRLRPQFPRPLTLNTLFERDYFPDPEFFPKDPDADDQEMDMWTTAGWSVFSALQRASCDWVKFCTRRGCGKPGKMKCKECKVLSFCGEECMKLESEHRDSGLCENPKILRIMDQGAALIETDLRMNTMSLNG